MHFDHSLRLYLECLVPYLGQNDNFLSARYTTSVCAAQLVPVLESDDIELLFP
jgi:hypothetical protein